MSRSNMVVLFNPQAEDEAKQEQHWQDWVKCTIQLKLSPSECDCIYDLWVNGEIGICLES